MAIINLQSALNAALNEMFGFWRYDAWLIVDGYVPAERLMNEARAIPGVEQAEAWGFTIGRYVRLDGSESDNLYLLAPPAASKLLNPPIIAGRGLRPNDTNAILVTPGLIAREPGVRLGGEITVKIDGREEIYEVVGVMNMMGNSTVGYFTVMSYEEFSRHVREPNRANAIILTLAPRSLAAQRLLTSQIEERYDRADLKVVSNFLITEEREEIDAAFAVIVALLMVMTVVLAFVGGLGLMGTMSLNVIERTREIGVMRAYGASSAAIFRIVIIEGLMIGMMSWVLSIGASLPFSILLAREIGLSFMDYPMAASYSLEGILAWAVIVIVISIIASLLPAMNAVRLTVTEVLAYE
jgi:putative ABC transport system permease protein